MANICHSISSTSDYSYRLLRGSTALGNSTVGSEGNRIGISCGTTNSSRGDGYSIHFLDSPNTTSQITYQVYWGARTDSSAMFLNQTSYNTGNWLIRTASSITAMEVAA